MLEGGGHACRREGEGHASPCLLDLEISISTCLLAYFAAAQLFEEMWLNPSASAPPFPLPPSPSLAKSVAGAYSVVLSCVGFLCGLTAKSGKGLGHSSLLRRLLWGQLGTDSLRTPLPRNHLPYRCNRLERLMLSSVNLRPKKWTPEVRWSFMVARCSL